MTQQPTEADASTVTGPVFEDEDWQIFRGDGRQHRARIPDAPPWRRFADAEGELAPGVRPHPTT